MMKMSVMSQLRKGHTLCVSLAFLLVMSVSLVSCDKRNIHQVVKELAEAPVDTTYFVSKSIHTNPFSTVDIDCFADVTFHQIPTDEEHFVVLKAPVKVLENLRVTVEDGDLSVNVDRRYKMPEKAVAVVEIYAPFVNSFILDGGKCLRLGKMVQTSPLEVILHGNVGAITADSLAVHEMALLLDGSGSYDLKNITTGALRAKVIGTGIMNLAGKCNNASLEVQGRGQINAVALQCATPVEFSVMERGKVLLNKKQKK